MAVCHKYVSLSSYLWAHYLTGINSNNWPIFITFWMEEFSWILYGEMIFNRYAFFTFIWLDFRKTNLRWRQCLLRNSSIVNFVYNRIENMREMKYDKQRGIQITLLNCHSLLWIFFNFLKMNILSQVIVEWSLSSSKFL